ncbi:SEL1-like repeat protein [Shinella daejeonensis]|uniref:peptidoglycan-binding protein n=1 Tax=Shinella daejeonensis TaxID=659017 RepID=UPI0020C7D22A|nr:peptidoglycan-binding protein [Shinella daejeonensis]MCP8896289.1 SEL1-like repeat protein [Shinella daejeonensis]
MNGSRNPQRHGERSSLDALNRTIEGLEARIEGLMAGSRDMRSRNDDRFPPPAEPARYENARSLPLGNDPVSEIVQRQRAIEGGRERDRNAQQRPAPRQRSSDHYASSQSARSALAGWHEQAPVKEIADALVSLRQDLRSDIAEGLEREMQALRDEFRGIRQLAEGRGNTDGLREELHRLSAGISQLGRQSSQTDGLRTEFDELRSVLDGLAREDSVRRVEDRWSRMEERISASDQGREDELVALAYRLDELKAQINAVSATPAIRALEGRIESIAEAVDTLARRAEPDSGRFVSQFAGLDARLDEITRAIAASFRMQQSGATDAAALQRLENRIADLAGHLDTLVRSPAPDQAIGQRLEALSSRIEELAGERAAQRLEERIDDLSRMLEENRQAPALGDDLAYYLSDISRKIEALDQGSVNDQLADRLDGIARRIDALDAPLGSPFPEERFSHLEGRLSAIADRLDATGSAPASDQEALRSLEAQIANLSTLIGTPAAGAMPSEVDHRLATIEDYMATNDEYIIEAARHAAETVMDAYRHAAPSGNVTGSDLEAISALAEDLRALEGFTRSSEERTARTFDALHETLVQIAGRLEQLDAPRENFGRREATMPRAEMPVMEFAGEFATLREDAVDLRDDENPFEEEDAAAGRHAGDAEAAEISAPLAGNDHRAAVDAADATVFAEPLIGGQAIEPADAAAGGPPEKPGLFAGLKRRFVPGRREPAPALERRQIDPVPSIDPSDELAPEDANQLLEPGSGAPDVRRILERVRANQAAGTRAGTAGGADKADFIAAARRAARMAAEETDTAAVAPVRKDEQDGAGKSVSAFSRHRRPILLAVGAVLLALMSYPLVSTLVKDDAAPAVTEEVAARTSAPSDAAPVAEIPADEPEPATRAATASASDEMTDGFTNVIDGGVETDAQAAAVPDAGPDAAAALDDTAGYEPIPVDPAEADASGPIVVPQAISPPELALAATDGDPLALFEVGARYTEGRGVEIDLAEAARWYELSAARDFAPAQYRLANLYEKGQGVERDLSRARDLYEKAAQRGNASAMHNLAVLLATGIGNATPDFTGAARWFQQASDLGVRDSQFNLAILYARGNGVKQDLEESYKWFAIAARDGDTDAAQKRDEVANAMRPEQLSNAKAKVDLWTPQPLDDGANDADVPDAWVGAPVKTASVDVEKAIRNIQAILNNDGFDAGPPDGRMGRRTEAAIKAFQKSVGQPQTGEIDDALVTELLKRNGKQD